jgi:hypothetical protein
MQQDGIFLCVRRKTFLDEIESHVDAPDQLTLL